LLFRAYGINGVMIRWVEMSTKRNDEWKNITGELRGVIDETNEEQ